MTKETLGHPSDNLRAEVKQADGQSFEVVVALNVVIVVSVVVKGRCGDRDDGDLSQEQSTAKHSGTRQE